MRHRGRAARQEAAPRGGVSGVDQAQPGDHAQVAQERCGARGHARVPPARRRGAVPLLRMAGGCGSARRGARRVQRVGPARARAPGAGRLHHHVVRHHRGRRPQRSHRALPRAQGYLPEAQGGRRLPARQRRPIRGRHHRRDAHRVPWRWRAERPRAPVLHAGAQGPHRARHARVPRGHARLCHRRLRAARAVARGAQLPARHRARGGRRAERARGPAVHLAALEQQVRHRGWHDLLQRARVL
mmetsp:Transcript_7235/g.21857  ORF Transcript_7235/g.21857 Transcript_7235/m.21857 type:complete len:243 (-) Transcript_7235:344-1072(-)